MECERLIDIMQGRRTIRSYKKEPIDEESLQRILDAATLPPTGADLLPYTVIVVRDSGRKSRIRQGAEEVEMRYHDSLTGRLKERFNSMGVSPVKPFLTDAPILLIVAGDKSKPYWQESTWLAIAYMILAIENEGLGSVTYTPPDTGFLSELLRLPDNLQPQVVLPIGFAAEQIPPKSSRPQGRIYLEEFTD